MATIHINTPTFLTLVRLILSPLMLPVLLVYLLPFNLLWINLLLALLFILLSITDFFDGYLARKLSQETMLGSALDPIADKFLIFSAFIALLAVHKIYFYWVILFLGREIFVMGLRQIALEHTASIRVSWLGKCKTVAQVCYITILIINPYQQLWFCGKGLCWNLVEHVWLIITLGLSLISAYHYYRSCMMVLKRGDGGDVHD